MTDPSERVNGSSTVPVPKVVSPTICARPAACIAPDMISAELAVLLSTSTTIGTSVAGTVSSVFTGVCCTVGVLSDVDNLVVQELARGLDGLVDVATRVAAQVEDDRVGAGRQRSVACGE